MKKIKKILIGSVSFSLFFSLIILSVQGIFTSGSNELAVMSNANLVNFDPNEIIHAVPVSTYPSVAAQGAILIDAHGGNIIYELNSRKRLPMASTTKIMTAITAIESGADLDKIIKISKDMIGAEGSSIYLYENERFTLLDLLYALMLNSANDAAEAIAISVAGSIEKFANMMNDKVRELNLRDTNFTNPHGLDHEQHYTTAFDLAQIAAYSLKNEIFYEIAAEKNRVIYPKNADGTDFHEGARYLRNHNKMLRIYKDAIGGKTGFTKRSGRCLVSGAERDGTRLVAVTLNATNDWNDHAEMLDYGFVNYHSIELCKEGEYKYEISVVNGADADIVRAENISAETASLPKDITLEDITIRVELPRFVYAPVQSGDIIGRVMFLHGEDNNLAGYSIIVASEDIKGAPVKKSFIDRIREFLGKEE